MMNFALKTMHFNIEHDEFRKDLNCTDPEQQKPACPAGISSFLIENSSFLIQVSSFEIETGLSDSAPPADYADGDHNRRSMLQKGDGSRR